MFSTISILEKQNFRKLTIVHKNGKVGTLLKLKKETDVDIDMVSSWYYIL